MTFPVGLMVGWLVNGGIEVENDILGDDRTIPSGLMACPCEDGLGGDCDTGQ